MSGFVTVPAEDLSPSGAVVPCGPFWPDIDLNHFRAVARVGNNTIPDVRMVEAIQGAVLDVARDLGSWRAVQEASGHATLAGC